MIELTRVIRQNIEIEAEKIGVEKAYAIHLGYDVINEVWAALVRDPNIEIRTTEGQRKAWDGCPDLSLEGWIMLSWVRHDFTEEITWFRVKPAPPAFPPPTLPEIGLLDESEDDARRRRELDEYRAAHQDDDPSWLGGQGTTGRGPTSTQGGMYP